MILFLLFCCIFYYSHCQVASTLHGNQFDAPKRRFEYKYSFKGPYLAQKNGKVPFWHYLGNTMASEDMVRITPSLKSKKGSIWTELQTSFEWWEVDISFRVNGRGRIGADGLAVWFTSAKYSEGPVFGSSDHWVGLGIFFDSFDNDNKGNNPYIMAMINDGTKSYDHETDGINQQLAGCLRDFRNRPFPVRAKIEYYKNVLSLSFSNGNTNADGDYETCFRVEHVFLPKTGYFGISAATGGLADDHDVLKFLTYSLHVPGSPVASAAAVQTIADPEKERAAKEYELYKDKLTKQKEEYLKHHPDEAKKLKAHDDTDPEHEYETIGERELQQIFRLSGDMFDMIKSLHRKLDEIIGQQRITLSLLSVNQFSGVQNRDGASQPPPPGHQQSPHVLPLPIQRHEVDALLNFQQELVRSTRDIMGKLNNKIQPESIQQGQEQLLISVRDSVKLLEKELVWKSGPNECATNCVSLMNFAIFICAQTLIIIAFLIYKNYNSFTSQKKFY